jgi:hypothetical protein
MSEKIKIRATINEIPNAIVSQVMKARIRTLKRCQLHDFFSFLLLGCSDSCCFFFGFLHFNPRYKRLERIWYLYRVGTSYGVEEVDDLIQTLLDGLNPVRFSIFLKTKAFCTDNLIIHSC